MAVIASVEPTGERVLTEPIPRTAESFAGGVFLRNEPVGGSEQIKSILERVWWSLPDVGYNCTPGIFQRSWKGLTL